MYSDEARALTIVLRQGFGQFSLKQGLCKLPADAGLLSMEVVNMLGDMVSPVKKSIKTLIPADHLGR